MGWEALLMISGKLFNVLSWPSFNLICPLYASIQAIESDSYSKNQQCLTYWVMFSLITFLELKLPMVFEWLPFWAYAKGMATVLLVIPYFGGASYIYKRFIRPYFSENSQIRSILYFPRRKDFMYEQNQFLDAADRDSNENGSQELETLLIYQDRDINENGSEELETLVIYQGTSEPTYDTTEKDYTWPTSQKKFQKEWSCAPCLISTTSEKDLKKHLRGKKHKAKEEELRVDELATKASYNSSFTLKKTNGMVFFANLNQIARVNFEKWSGLLSPVAKSIRWCRWKKPEFGWTKLNTDGSIDRVKGGFGGLLRDYKGDAICAFVSKSTRDDIFLAELWAIWRGLVLASGLGIKFIWVESDSLSVVKTINREQPYSAKASSCLKHIWELLRKFEKYQVSHSWREANRAADHLAKMVLVGNDVILWPTDFPESLCKIIKDDAQGRRYRRV